MRRILSAGSLLFRKQGFDGTTIQQIAERADVGTGTVFLYVADKSELLLLLYENAMEERLQIAAAELTGNRSFENEIARFFAHLFELYSEDLSLARVYIREFLFHEGEVRKRLDAQTTRILQLLGERIAVEHEAGRINSSITPETAALHIYSLYHATLAFSLAGCSPSNDPEELFRCLLRSFAVGLLPREKKLLAADDTQSLQKGKRQVSKISRGGKRV